MKKLKAMAVLAFCALAINIIGCFTCLGIEIAQERKLDKLNQKNRDNLDAYKNAQYRKLDEDLKNGLIDESEWKSGRDKVDLIYKNEYYIKAASKEDSEQYSTLKDRQTKSSNAALGFGLAAEGIVIVGAAAIPDNNSEEKSKKTERSK